MLILSLRIFLRRSGLWSHPTTLKLARHSGRDSEFLLRRGAHKKILLNPPRPGLYWRLHSISARFFTVNKCPRSSAGVFYALLTTFICKVVRKVWRRKNRLGWISSFCAAGAISHRVFELLSAIWAGSWSVQTVGLPLITVSAEVAIGLQGCLLREGRWKDKVRLLLFISNKDCSQFSGDPKKISSVVPERSRERKITKVINHETAMNHPSKMNKHSFTHILDSSQ